MLGIIAALLAALLQLSVGLLCAAVLTDWRSQVTRGFLALAAVTALVSGGLAFALGGLLNVGFTERLLNCGLVLALLLYALALVRASRRRRLGIGAVGLALGGLLLVVAAAARPSPEFGPLLTALAFLASTLALGAGLGGLLLGHWYLMTPWLTARPLRLLCDLLLASLAGLSALAVWYLGRAAGGLTVGGLSGVALWLGTGMVTLFPLAVTVAARSCCIDGPGRGRAIQAATGLLYLVAAALLAGGLAGNAVLLGA